MKSKTHLLRIGIVGCGAIGSRMAVRISQDFKKECRLTGIYDIEKSKVEQLAKSLKSKSVIRNSFKELIDNCDLMVEAVNADNTTALIRQALKTKRSVLVMSVGKLLHDTALFRLANRSKCHLLLPSGAVAGIDAIKAADLVGIDSITLTTRKSPAGFENNLYLKRKGIEASQIKGQTILFDGDVSQAVRAFPQNINVAATIALAARSRKKIRIRIIASPAFKMNSHEIELNGKFGRIVTKTNNTVCPDNPKTSYLAVLSGLQSIKQYCSGIFIGT